ncbi:hypothetical protein KVF89_06650 [Nocardioides carbamazepini]|uniref:hypothetical protein n=1 Tax=Nocardioides carbamazepini TaxID=2854259 RepID=UPI002149C6B4|nr:hypothetical protein [Nocardioides carbamazepini]MCR1782206.1 hypothetical protein [Nocardioides carbamazepini]
MDLPYSAATEPDDRAADRAHLDAARQCVLLWHQSPKAMEAPAALNVKFRVSYPMLAHALNHVHQALAAMERFPLVATTSARIALEHALTAQWILLTHGGELVVANHMKHSWMTRSRLFAEATGTQDELRPILDLDPIPGNERSFSAQVLCHRFDESGLFYDLYRELSQGVHPSYGTISAHFEIVGEVDDNQRALTSTSRNGAAQRVDATATGLGLAAVLAIDAFERFRDGSPRLPEVEAIATAAGLPHDLRFSDQLPDLQKPSGSA